jgi:hypothetical protein
VCRPPCSALWVQMGGGVFGHSRRQLLANAAASPRGRFPRAASLAAGIFALFRRRAGFHFATALTQASSTVGNARPETATPAAVSFSSTA